MLEMPSSMPAATAGPMSSPAGHSQARTGASMPAARSSSASVGVATPSDAAPPRTAALADSTAPCP